MKLYEIFFLLILNNVNLMFIVILFFLYCLIFDIFGLGVYEKCFLLCLFSVDWIGILSVV